MDGAQLIALYHMFVPSSTSSLFCIEAEVQLIIRRLADAAAVPAKVGHHTVLPVDQRPHPLGPAVFRARKLVPQHDAGLCRCNAAGRADDGTTSHCISCRARQPASAEQSAWPRRRSCQTQPARAPSATSPHVTWSCDPRRVRGSIFHDVVQNQVWLHHVMC